MSELTREKLEEIHERADGFGGAVGLSLAKGASR